MCSHFYSIYVLTNERFSLTLKKSYPTLTIIMKTSLQRLLEVSPPRESGFFHSDKYYHHNSNLFKLDSLFSCHICLIMNSSTLKVLMIFISSNTLKFKKVLTASSYKIQKQVTDFQNKIA